MGSFFGSTDDVAAILGNTSNEMMSYIDSSVNQFIANTGGMGTAIADRAMEQYNHFVETNTGNRVAVIANKLNAFWEGDHIRAMSDGGMIQQAPNSMVRWIMTNPDVRELYHDGRMEGYGDRYIDVQPGVIGKDQYDYRRVNDGMVKHSEEGSNYSNFHEKLLDADYVLNCIEKACIASTNEILSESILDGIDDFTSPWNNTIG